MKSDKTGAMPGRRVEPRQEDYFRAIRKVIDHVRGQLGSSRHVIDTKLRYGFIRAADVAVHGNVRYIGFNHLIDRRHQGVDISWREEDAVYASVDDISQVARLLR